MLDGNMAHVAANALQDVKFLVRSGCKGHASGVSVEVGARAIDLSEYPYADCVANACDSLRRVATALCPSELDDVMRSEIGQDQRKRVDGIDDLNVVPFTGMSFGEPAFQITDGQQFAVCDCDPQGRWTDW
ncbi:hypothetical protein ILFOPFJJ_05754 [Ensifer psoraleae]|nr:hypothetical protein [Sinorhizobium psoraleae]